MSPYSTALAIFLAVVAVIAVAFWVIPALRREKPAAAAVGHREQYGEPPGLLRAVHHDELGFRGWADMPGEFEGNSVSALLAHVERNA